MAIEQSNIATKLTEEKWNSLRNRGKQVEMQPRNGTSRIHSHHFVLSLNSSNQPSKFCLNYTENCTDLSHENLS